MNIRRIVCALAAMIASSGAACNRDEPTAVTDRTGGRTQVLLTDAPFPYDSVGRVDIYIVSIAASTVPDTSPANTSWVTIAEPLRRYNLLDLQHGTTALLGEGDLPAGEYVALRVVIDTDSSAIWSKYAINADGSVKAGYEPLPVSWQSSAGRPKLYALVEEAMAVGSADAKIVIDFDVGRSFFPLPSGGFVFSPVLRAVNESATGTIRGRVLGDTLASNPEPIGDVTITVFSGNPASAAPTWSVRATARTDSDGRFNIAYLLPGTYIVSSDAPRASLYTSGIRANVVVVKQQVTDNVDITLPRRAVGGLTIFPASRTMLVGRADSLHAWLTDSQGNAITDAEFTWTSSAPSVASVEKFAGYQSIALVRALSSGNTTIQACAFDRCVSSAITVVNLGPVARIDIYPVNPTTHVGDTLWFYAFPRDSAGNYIDGKQKTWSVDDATIVQMNPNGSTRELKAGTTTVRVAVDGITASTGITVLASAAPPRASVDRRTRR